jgi:hypothetical protein
MHFNSGLIVVYFVFIALEIHLGEQAILNFELKLIQKNDSNEQQVFTKFDNSTHILKKNSSSSSSNNNVVILWNKMIDTENFQSNIEKLNPKELELVKKILELNPNLTNLTRITTKTTTTAKTTSKSEEYEVYDYNFDKEDEEEKSEGKLLLTSTEFIRELTSQDDLTEGELTTQYENTEQETDYEYENGNENEWDSEDSATTTSTTTTTSITTTTTSTSISTSTKITSTITTTLKTTSTSTQAKINSTLIQSTKSSTLSTTKRKNNSTLGSIVFTKSSKNSIISSTQTTTTTKKTPSDTTFTKIKTTLKPKITDSSDNGFILMTCTKEFDKYCLNRGECFLKFANSNKIEPVCKCNQTYYEYYFYDFVKVKYSGQRCEQLNYRPTLNSGLSILFIVSLISLLVTCICLNCCCTKKQHKTNSKLNENSSLAVKNEFSDSGSNAAPKEDPDELKQKEKLYKSLNKNSWKYLRIKEGGSGGHGPSKEEEYELRNVFDEPPPNYNQKSLNKYLDKRSRNFLKSLESIASPMTNLTHAQSSSQSATAPPLPVHHGCSESGRVMNINENFIFINRTINTKDILPAILSSIFGRSGLGSLTSNKKVNENDRLDARFASNVFLYPKPSRTSNDLSSDQNNLNSFNTNLSKNHLDEAIACTEPHKSADGALYY